jgi:hypothetical protein
MGDDGYRKSGIFLVRLNYYPVLSHQAVNVATILMIHIPDLFYKGCGIISHFQR